MTITTAGAGQLIGLAADTKPTTYATGTRFFETDTGVEYYWNGTAWVRAGGGAPDISSVIYVAGDGTGDYTTLAAALTAQGANKEYKLSPGVHSISTQLVSSLSNVTIKGSGAGITTLQIEPAVGSTGAGIIVQGSLGTGKALTANSLRGVNTLTMSSTSGIAANDWVYLKCTRQIQSAGNNGTDAEIHQVKSVSGTVITLKDYLYEDYTTALTSTVYKITWVSNFTLRDLTVYDARTTPVTGITEQADCLFLFCYNLQLSNVVFDRMYYCSVALQNCYNCTLTNVSYDSPQFLNSATYWVNYGLDILSASTNITVNGGWANRCRHSVTTDCIAGQTYGGGRQRNIAINGMVSYNSNTSHFDNHEGVTGMVYNGCTAIGGYHQLDADYVYTGSHTQQTDQVKGFTARSPTVFNACVAQNCENYGFAFFNDNDTTAASDTQPGSDGTTMINCRVLSTQTGDGTSVGVTRGVRLLPNRKDISIIGCYFSNILEEPIMVGDGCNNITIKDNIFHTCGASLSSSRGMIRFLGTHTDAIITGNTFGAGTPPGSAHPAEFTTAINRLIFSGNDLNGLTNKSLISASSTEVYDYSNLGTGVLIPNITPHPGIKKTGDWFAFQQLQSSSGILQGIWTATTTGTGVLTGIVKSSTGTKMRWTTGATAGSSAGNRTTVGGVTFFERDLNPLFSVKVQLGQTTNERCFIGLINSAAAPTLGVDPLASLTGLGFFLDTGVDNNWHIIQNNATGSDTTTIPNVAAADTNAHVFSLRGVNASTKFQYAYTSGVPDSSTTWVDINTKIPGATTGINLYFHLENIGANTDTFDVFWVHVETDA